MDESTEDGVIYIGKKGLMPYVLAVMTQLNKGAKEVRLKARGKSISMAVDVAEIVRSKFAAGIKVGNVMITTEELRNGDGSTSRVSAIEIPLSR